MTNWSPWCRRSTSGPADQPPSGPADLNDTPLVSRETGSGTRDALSSALRSVLGPSSRQAEPAIELSSAAAMRAAVLAGAGPAVMSRLAVEDDLTLGRLREVPIAGLTCAASCVPSGQEAALRRLVRCETCSATSRHISTAESDVKPSATQ